MEPKMNHKPHPELNSKQNKKTATRYEHNHLASIMKAINSTLTLTHPHFISCNVLQVHRLKLLKTDEKGVFEMLFIAIGASIRTFVNYLRPFLIIDAAHLKGQYNGTNLVAVGMDGNNQIVPIAFSICKGETGPFWSWWISVLKECIGDSPNLLFISDRHAAIALAVHNEFPLAFHAICCRHLMMNLSLKRKKMKGLFWKICKAYTPEEFSAKMRNLQDLQPDAYNKLYEAGPERWSRAHCPLVHYNYMTLNIIESVNACTVLYRKLPVLKLAETYRAMVQECLDSGLVPLADAIQDRDMLLMYTQTHQNRLQVYVSQVKISPLVVADQRKDERNKKENQRKPSCSKRKIPRRFTSLYYTLPPNIMLSGMKAIKNDYDTNVMYDIAKVARNLQLFVSHYHIDLSTVLIPNDGSLEESFASITSEETKIKQQESLNYLHQMQKRNNKKFDY
ncbi:transposase, MuDR, MULE transposase domain protein [Tanacetum coccineum]